MFGALPGQPVAHLREPHRVVGVEQGLGSLGPMLRNELQHDEQPRDEQQQHKIWLAHLGAGHEPARIQKTRVAVQDMREQR